MQKGFEDKPDWRKLTINLVILFPIAITLVKSQKEKKYY